MKKKSILPVILGSLGAGVVAFFIYDAFKKKKSLQTSGIGGFGTEDYISTGTNSTESFPLKRGANGEKTKALQRFLNSEENAGLTVDGAFGTLTEKAWLKNQVCDIIATTSTNCWKNYKQQYPGAVVGQVDKEFYDKFVSMYEN